VATVTKTNNMTKFAEELIKIIVEKGLLVVGVAIVGYWISKYLEIDKQKNLLKNKIIEDNRDKIVSTVEKQLALFYYPIYFRLQKDNALWKLSPQLAGEIDSLPPETNDIIEKEYIIKNHIEILSIIESNIHLIEMDNELQESINAYIKHVAVYQIIRRTKSIDKLNPIVFNAPYPKLFIEIINVRMTRLQKMNNELLNVS
jgi:hypothetical protein